MAVILFAALAAVAIAYATWRHSAASGHVAMAFLAVASPYATWLLLTVPIDAPGYALDPVTHVPVGSAVPPFVRLMSGPFNIARAFTLVFGALFSAYVFMPKRRVLGRRRLPPVVARCYGAVAILVNLVTSLPRAAAALVRGELNSRVPATLLIALGGFIPGITSGANRFGITRSFFLGELLGVVSREVFATRSRRSEAAAVGAAAGDRLPISQTADRSVRR